MQDERTTRREPSVVFTCALCGAEFRVHGARKATAKYCSAPCYWSAKRGQPNPALQTRVERACLRCGATFLAKPSAVKRGAGRYCSGRCAGAARGDAFAAHRTSRTCLHCGLLFEVKSQSPKQRYCSQRCSAKATVPVGPNSHLWRGGTRRSPADRQSVPYRDWREAVYRRDDYRCQSCGQRSGEGRKIVLHAHHLESWATCPEKRYDEANGVTLCRDCHRALHHLL